jgi:hypothetical protein
MCPSLRTFRRFNSDMRQSYRQRQRKNPLDALAPSAVSYVMMVHCNHTAGS